MKNLFFILCTIILLTSCNTYQGYKIIGDGKNCFNKTELQTIINTRKEKKSDYLGIRPLVEGRKKCIGLYGISFSNLNVSAVVVEKALKFGNSVYLYQKNDNKANKKAYDSFENNYKQFFTLKELEELKASFFKGTELEGRLY